MIRFPFLRRAGRRPPEAAPTPAHELDPLADRIVQVCSWDLPGFTVVRVEAELEWVVRAVSTHEAALDEWTPDFLDAEINARHDLRLAQIDAQAHARTQEATRARADAEAVRTAAGVKVAALRARESELAAEVRQWQMILTGQNTGFDVPTPGSATPPVCADPLPSRITRATPEQPDPGPPPGIRAA